MAIYFLRHGESQANVDDVFAGQMDDSPLTTLGLQQARQAASDIGSLRVDRIISSSLQRTRKTAGVVASIIGFDPAKVEIDDRITEYDMGVLTGKPRHATDFF